MLGLGTPVLLSSLLLFLFLFLLLLLLSLPASPSSSSFLSAYSLWPSTASCSSSASSLPSLASSSSSSAWSLSPIPTVTSPLLPRHRQPPRLPLRPPRPSRRGHRSRSPPPPPSPPLPRRNAAPHHPPHFTPAAASAAFPFPQLRTYSALNKDYDVYDVIILGTGLKESALGSLLASLGKKVLHVDRGAQYGGDSASLTPLNLACRRFPVPGSTLATVGHGRSWKMDLLPKFIMASGQLVRMLTQLGALRFLDLRVVDASFLYKDRRLQKVPSAGTEALGSGLIGVSEKQRFLKFFMYALRFDKQDPSTYEGVDPRKTTVKDLFQRFDLGHDVTDFAGHALALSFNNSYLECPCLEMLEKIQLYTMSLAKNGKSPYLYPCFGIGELAQAFARVTSNQGGLFLMNRPVEEILVRDGRVMGILSEGQIARCRQLICDPSYVPDLVCKVGQAIRAICILGHPVRNTSGANSGLIIIPSAQTKRISDIYIFLVSSVHNTVARGKYVAMVSTVVESKDPDKEIQLALELLEPIEQKFFFISDLLVPNDLSTKSQIFITTSHDATVHFENACDDIKEIYRKMTGSELKLD